MIIIVIIYVRKKCLQLSLNCDNEFDDSLLKLSKYFDFISEYFTLHIILHNYEITTIHSMIDFSPLFMSSKNKDNMITINIT